MLPTCTMCIICDLHGSRAQHKVTYAVEAPRSARDFQTDPRQKVLNWSLEHSFAEAEDYTLHETNYSKQGEIQL